MMGLSTLVKRNIRLFIIDRAAVFFSLLGALLAIILVLVFLKSTLVDSVTTSFDGLIDAAQAGHLLDAWIVPSAAVIASATTGLGALRQFVDDAESTRWRDFLVSPQPRWIIVAGYLIAATIISIGITTVVYVLGTVYALASGAPLAWSGVMAAWGWLVLSCLAFTALMGFVAALLKTAGAYTGFATIVGVCFGFLAGTYVTAGSLPTSVANVLNCLPFAQASALVRQPYTNALIDSFPAQTLQITREQLGMTLSVGGVHVGTPVIVAVLAGMAVIFSVLAWQTMSRTVKR